MTWNFTLNQTHKSVFLFVSILKIRLFLAHVNRVIAEQTVIHLEILCCVKY